MKCTIWGAMCFTVNQISLILTSPWLCWASATGVTRSVPLYLLLSQCYHPNVFKLEKSGKGETTTIYHSLISLVFNYFCYFFVFQWAERVWKGLQVPPLPPWVPGAKLHGVQRNLHWTCKSRFSLANLLLRPYINTYFPCWDNPQVSFTLLRDGVEVGGLEGKMSGQRNRNRRGNLRELFVFCVTHHTCNPQPQALQDLLVLCLFTENIARLTYVCDHMVIW